MAKRASAAEQRRIERALLRRLPEDALYAFLAREQTARDVAKEYGDRGGYDCHHAAVRMVREILEERERPFLRSDLTVNPVPPAPVPCRGCSRPSTHTKHDGREDVPVCDDCIFTR